MAKMANTIYHHIKCTFVCELTLCAENLGLNVHIHYDFSKKTTRVASIRKSMRIYSRV